METYTLTVYDYNSNVIAKKDVRAASIDNLRRNVWNDFIKSKPKVDFVDIHKKTGRFVGSLLEGQYYIPVWITRDTTYRFYPESGRIGEVLDRAEDH